MSQVLFKECKCVLFLSLCVVFRFVPYVILSHIKLSHCLPLLILHQHVSGTVGDIAKNGLSHKSPLGDYLFRIARNALEKQHPQLADEDFQRSLWMGTQDNKHALSAVCVKKLNMLRSHFSSLVKKYTGEDCFSTVHLSITTHLSINVLFSFPTTNISNEKENALDFAGFGTREFIANALIEASEKGMHKAESYKVFCDTVLSQYVSSKFPKMHKSPVKSKGHDGKICLTDKLKRLLNDSGRVSLQVTMSDEAFICLVVQNCLHVESCLDSSAVVR